jgi:hypothetical protein
MSLRPPFLALAAATLLLSACGDDAVSVYKVPKEKEPEAPVAAAADPGAAAAPAGGPAMADTAVPTASGDGLLWQAPAGWSQKPAGAMRKASYAVPGDDGESDFSVTAFPGDVGGELANVNRWRGQIALPPLAPEQLDGAVTRLDQAGLKVTLVELSSAGDPKNKAILGAIIPYGGATWFFKLSGPGTSVRQAKPAFMDFLHSVHAP